MRLWLPICSNIQRKYFHIQRRHFHIQWKLFSYSMKIIFIFNEDIFIFNENYFHIQRRHFHIQRKYFHIQRQLFSYATEIFMFNGKFSYSTNIIFIFNEKLFIFNDYKIFSYLTNINITGNLGLVCKLLFQNWSQPARKQRPFFTRTDYTDIDWPNFFYKLSFLVEELRVQDCQDIDSLVELKEKLDGAVNCLLVLSCDAPSFTSKNVDGLLNQIRMFSQEIHREIIGFRRRDSERLAVFGLNRPFYW